MGAGEKGHQAEAVGKGCHSKGPATSGPYRLTQESQSFWVDRSHCFSTRSAPDRSPLASWSPTMTELQTSKTSVSHSKQKIIMTRMHHTMHHMILTYCRNHFAICAFIRSLCCTSWPNAMLCINHMSIKPGKMHQLCSV